MELDYISRNIERVRQGVAAAAARVGRDAPVRIVAATKTVDADRVAHAAAAGIVDVGENRLQEAVDKMDALSSDIRAGSLVWHFIGHLQRNKVRQVVGRFELIHAVDSIRLLEKINQTAAGLGIIQACLLSVNIAGEASKHGLLPDGLDPLIAELPGLENVIVKGLMTIPPVSDSIENSRQYFRELKRIGTVIDKRDIKNLKITEYSMGMSADYIVAVEEGATMIRPGSIIFGRRN